jgi:predicted amidophosphoribosyltransferase
MGVYHHWGNSLSGCSSSAALVSTMVRKKTDNKFQATLVVRSPTKRTRIITRQFDQRLAETLPPHFGHRQQHFQIRARHL